MKYHAVLDAQDVDGVAACLAAEARYVSPAIGDVVGREAILASIRAYFAASPDHQAFDDEVKTTGPRSAAKPLAIAGREQDDGRGH